MGFPALGGLFGQLGSLGTLISNPFASGLVNTAVGWLQGEESRSRQPAVPNFLQPFGGQGQNVQGGLGSPGSIPGVTNPALGSIQNAYVATEQGRAQAQQQYNDRLLSLLGDVRQSQAQGQGTVDATLRGVGQRAASTYGDFDSAFTGLQEGLKETRGNTAQSIKNTKQMVGDFFAYAGGLRKDMATMSAGVMSSLRDNTAALLSQASNGIKNQTESMLNDTIPALQAQGVPMGQITNIAAQVSADGARTMGDMITQIGVSENARATATQVELGKMQTALDSTLGQAAGGILGTAIGEVGGTLRAQNQVEQGFAALKNSLTDQKANYDSAVNSSVAGLAALRNQMAVQGDTMALNILGNVQDYVMDFGSILEGMFGLQTNLSDFNYQRALGNFDIGNAQAAMAFNQWYSGSQNMVQIQEAHHMSGVAERQASQDAANGWGMWAADTFLGSGSALGGMMGAAPI